MNLSETLQEQKKQIQTIWVDRTLDSYTSSGFFKKSLDKIANPTGGNIREGLSAFSTFSLMERIRKNTRNHWIRSFE